MAFPSEAPLPAGPRTPFSFLLDWPEP